MKYRLETIKIDMVIFHKVPLRLKYGYLVKSDKKRYTYFS
jgi:hypothetical protein